MYIPHSDWCLPAVDFQHCVTSRVDENLEHCMNHLCIHMVVVAAEGKGRLLDAHTVEITSPAGGKRTYVSTTCLRMHSLIVSGALLGTSWSQRAVPKCPARQSALHAALLTLCCTPLFLPTRVKAKNILIAVGGTPTKLSLPGAVSVLVGWAASVRVVSGACAATSSTQDCSVVHGLPLQHMNLMISSALLPPSVWLLLASHTLLLACIALCLPSLPACEPRDALPPLCMHAGVCDHQ